MERFELPTAAPDVTDGAGHRHRPVTRRAPAPSYAGLVGLGALAGSATGAAFGAFVGWSGPMLSLAALVGVDVGLLLGAGAGSWLVRRQRRGRATPPRTRAVRPS